MKRTTLLASPILTAMHPGNPHGLRYAEGDTGEQGGGSNGTSDEPKTDGDGEEKPAPWEKSGAGFDAEKAKTYIASLRSERDREAAARKAAEAKVRDYEDAQLTETEKLERERETYRTDASETRARLDRYEVAEEVGLPLSWARRLVGDDRAALLADAQAMKADLGEMPKGGPRPDPSQGGGGDGTSRGSVADAKADYLAGRKKR